MLGASGIDVLNHSHTNRYPSRWKLHGKVWELADNGRLLKAYIN